MISCLGSHAMRPQKCSTMPSPHATVIRTIFRWMILIVLVTFPLISWRKTILSWINSFIQAHALLQMPASYPETLYVLVRWVRYLAPHTYQPTAPGFYISHIPGSKHAFELLGCYSQVPEVISVHQISQCSTPTWWEIMWPGMYEILSFPAYQMGYLDREGARVYGFP